MPKHADDSFLVCIHKVDGVRSGKCEIIGFDVLLPSEQN